MEMARVSEKDDIIDVVWKKWASSNNACRIRAPAGIAFFSLLYIYIYKNTHIYRREQWLCLGRYPIGPPIPKL